MSPAERKEAERKRRYAAVQPTYQLGMVGAAVIAGIGPGGPDSIGLLAGEVLKDEPKSPEGVAERFRDVGARLSTVLANVKKDDFDRAEETSFKGSCPRCGASSWQVGNYTFNEEHGLEEATCSVCSTVADVRQPSPSPMEQREALGMVIPANTDSTLAERDTFSAAQHSAAPGGRELTVSNIRGILSPIRPGESVSEERAAAVLAEARKPPSPSPPIPSVSGTAAPPTWNAPNADLDRLYPALFDQIAGDPRQNSRWEPDTPRSRFEERLREGRKRTR